MVTKRALIQWIPAEQGGRRSGPPSGPQYTAPAKFLAHADKWLVSDWSLVVGKISFVGCPDKWLADIHFLVEAAPQQWLADGAEFELYEGKKCVARGRIEQPAALSAGEAQVLAATPLAGR